jgi:glycosyltransferase involved in cell wall biosynthesis
MTDPERLRIVWLKTELLHPVDKGGRIRTYQMLRHLAAHHTVTYVTLDDGTAAPDAMDRAGEYAARVVRIPFAPPSKRSPAFVAALLGNLPSALPYAIARYRSPAMREAIREATQGADLVVCDFLTPAINLPDHLAAPTLLFQHNVEAMIWERHAEVARDPLRRTYMHSQFRRMAAFERAACRRVDHVVAVSPQDAQVMTTRYGPLSVGSVPTGTDIDFFAPQGRGPSRANHLVFTGSMDWMPNADAIEWFLRSILPRIRRTLPEVTVSIVGRSPSDALRREAGAAGGVEVTGRVDDVRPLLEAGSVFIVPMRVGGGTRLKIFEAMAMGLPVISTAVGAEGLPLTDGRDIVLRDDAESFAAAVVTMLGEGAYRETVARAGQQLVRERFGWSGVAEAFLAECRIAIANRRRTTSTHIIS